MRCPRCGYDRPKHQFPAWSEHCKNCANGISRDSVLKRETTTRVKRDRDQISADVEAYVANGGKIKEVKSDQLGRQEGRPTKLQDAKANRACEDIR